MINTITINGVATYRTPTTLSTDKKVNLVYGLNGTGKSTLSQLLKNPSDPKFSKCQYQQPIGTKILVYNQSFIDETFFQSSEIKGVFSLSEENKAIETQIEEENKNLAAKIEELETLQRNKSRQQESMAGKNKAAIESTWKIKKQFADDDKTLSDFLIGKRSNKQELFNFLHNWKLPQKEPRRTIADIKKDYLSLKNPNSKHYATIPKAIFDAKKIEESDIFTQRIVGSNNSTVASLIVELENSDWVRSGLAYIDETKSEPQSCPFCQSQTVTPSLVEEIKNYFDKTYEDSIARLEDLNKSYSEKISLLEEFEKVEIPEIVHSEQEAMLALYQALKNQAETNQSSISEKIKSPSEEKKIKITEHLLLSLNAKIEEINKKITDHNSKLDNVTDEIRKLGDEFWDNMRWHYNETINHLDSDLKEHNRRLKALESEKTTREQEKSRIQQTIENLQSKTVNIDKAVNSINDNLTSIGITDFSIKKHDDALYKIERNDQKRTDITTLSEGEKTIITFLYFLELCKGKSSPNEVQSRKIVVIDDPVSSLSHIYVFNIGEIIKSDFFNNGSFDQVFVLTHSLYFFYELTDINDERRKETQKLHRISKNSSGSFISEMKYEEIQNDYQTYWSIVNDPQQNAALIANCMRNIVEYFFNFVEKLNLNDVFAKPSLKDPKFQAFKRYINRESHSVGQNIFDLKEFNYQDFKEGLRLVFVESGYPAHYKKMAKIKSA